MKKFLEIIILILFCSCASIGTKTIFNTNDAININILGLNNLDEEYALLNIYPLTSDIFNSVVIEISKKYGINDTKLLNLKISYVKPDMDVIREICRDKNLDALLLSKLIFIGYQHTNDPEPFGTYLDAKVEMKLYNKEGKLLCISSHNTLRRNLNYWTFPRVGKSIRDATKNTLIRIYTEKKIFINKK